MAPPEKSPKGENPLNNSCTQVNDTTFLCNIVNQIFAMKLTDDLSCCAAHKLSGL